MAFELGNSPLPPPVSFMESSGIATGVGVHKRAYASLQLSSDASLVGCAGGITKIESAITQKHSELLKSDSGRLAPPPSLESVSLSNDGGQNIEDAMLFQADVSIKVFRKDDFDDIDVTFMTPRQKVDLTLGWVGGKKKIIKGEITGFSFTINQDLSYDVTLSIAGAGDGLANADYTTLRDKGALDYEDEESGKRVTSTDIFANFVAAAAEIDTKPDDGRADYFTRKGIKIGLVNHQMEREGFFSYFTSNDNVQPYVTIGQLITYINQNSQGITGTPKEKFVMSELKMPPLDDKIKSANPIEMIFRHTRGAAKYGDNASYTRLNDEPYNGLGKIWVHVGWLQKTYTDLKTPPGKEDAGRRVSTSKFLKKVFDKVKELSGGAIQLCLYNDPDECFDGKFLVLNKPTASKKSSPTMISVAKGYQNGIRDISLTSNLDSELIGMATAAAMDGEGGEQLNVVFNGCYQTKPAGEGEDLEGALEEAAEALGDNISNDDITNMKQALKAYVKGQNKKFVPSISYGLECELTCDGYVGPRYGQSFTVDRLPARIRDKAYFIVTKIGQEFSAGDWTTKISGLMMIDA